MIDPKKIEQIARQVHESMPKGLRDLGEDVEKKIRQVLQSQLTRLDLVSREEFDVQTQVLLRTREKLALLEQRLSELENRPFIFAEVEENEEELEKLKNWFKKIQKRQIVEIPEKEQAITAIAKCEEVFEQFSAVAYERADKA